MVSTSVLVARESAPALRLTVSMLLDPVVATRGRWVSHRSRRGDAMDDVSAHATTILDLSDSVDDANMSWPTRHSSIRRTRCRSALMSPRTRRPHPGTPAQRELGHLLLRSRAKIQATFVEGGTLRTVRSAASKPLTWCRRAPCTILPMPARPSRRNSCSYTVLV